MLLDRLAEDDRVDRCQAQVGEKPRVFVDPGRGRNPQVVREDGGDIAQDVGSRGNRHHDLAPCSRVQAQAYSALRAVMTRRGLSVRLESAARRTWMRPVVASEATTSARDG